MAVIELNNLNFSYDNKNNILKNIDLKIEEGEIFGLIGPSGAGKTTIIKLLTGQLYSKDNVKVFNDIPKGKLFYEQIGFVMDSIGLYERLTCYENLKIMSMIHNVNVLNIMEKLEMVGLKDDANKAVYKLSSGMRQRLLIARGILHSPRILFLDEPTRGLDPATAKDIQEIFLKIKDEGTTIFLTSHNMQEVENICDSVGFLFNGELVECGKINAIKEKYEMNKRVSFIDDEGVKSEYDIKKDKKELIDAIKSNNSFYINSETVSLEDIFIKLKRSGVNAS
ncbi:ABC transporter ATP-binding protein [Lachnospira multipara]|uniref:ABC-2 type transport system ATP-binding protein n=1 Tax=Lachnospira multipara TaxID=28051 RepID=A0A1H5SG93_9FIRM|nr:ABC transporter ATP-binding protein [Lachnospira multipara]SEF49495.1 ABC-2 type transport system ATP-binding protein [Lachnospira multipara]